MLAEAATLGGERPYALLAATAGLAAPIVP